MRLLLFLLFPAFCAGQNQSISFGVQTDTSGAVYFIRQLVTRKADTTLTTASAIRFEKAGDAIAAIESVLSVVRQDSAEIQAMYRNTMRQLSELRQSLAVLRPPANNPTNEPLTPEQEIARLRAENERLRAGQKKE